MSYQSKADPADRNLGNADLLVGLDLYTAVHVSERLELRTKVRNLVETQDYSQPLGNPSNYDAEWAGRRWSGEVRFRF